jgi:hypothetical protein
MAMLNQVITYREQGYSEKAVEIHQTLIERYQDRDEVGISEWVVIAMLSQANLFAIQRKWTESASYYQQALSQIINFSQFDIYRSTASLGLFIAQQADSFSEKECIALVEVIKEANNKSSAEERMLLALGVAAILPNKIALDIIQRSDSKDGLQPLLIALRQENGETVRSSEEMLELVADVRIRINELRAKYFKVGD